MGGNPHNGEHMECLRLSSTAFLDACDRRGVLVIDEFTDSWQLPKRTDTCARYFDGQWEMGLRAMVPRDTGGFPPIGGLCSRP